MPQADLHGSYSGRWMRRRRAIAAAALLLLPFAVSAQPGPDAPSRSAAIGFLPFDPAGGERQEEGGPVVRQASETVDGRWVARLDRTDRGWTVTLVEHPEGAGDSLFHFWGRILPAADDSDEPPEIWPHVLVEPDGAVLIGLETTRSSGFSGGGEGSARLFLYRLSPERTGLALAGELPLSGSASIRACFDEDDRRARLDACHDEYVFETALAAEPDPAGGPSRLILVTRARTFPGRRSRTEDSLAGPPLRRADLAWADDPACSYRRVYTFDAETGRYRPDEPLPDCPDYFGF
jgi:hypothetical protein